MNKLNFWTGFNERKNKHYFAEAQILDHVPNVGEELLFLGAWEVVDAIRPAWIDAEQPCREVFKYSIFEIEIHDAEDDEDSGYRYIAVLNEPKED